MRLRYAERLPTVHVQLWVVPFPTHVCVTWWLAVESLGCVLAWSVFETWMLQYTPSLPSDWQPNQPPAQDVQP